MRFTIYYKYENITDIEQRTNKEPSNLKQQEKTPNQTKLAIPLSVPQYLPLTAKDQEKQAIVALSMISFD